jgi:hypothetical protein
MLRIIGVALILGLLGWVGLLDYESALIIDAIEKEQRPIRVTRANLELAPAFPIPYDATVTQSLPSGREAVTRYYTRRANGQRQ